MDEGPAKQMTVDTTSIKKTAFKVIGLRKFADAAPMGDTIKKDTIMGWEKDPPLPSAKSSR